MKSKLQTNQLNVIVCAGIGRGKPNGRDVHAWKPQL